MYVMLKWFKADWFNKEDKAQTYKCRSCKRTFIAERTISEPLPHCPICGSNKGVKKK